jgi:hypothetical protein
MRKERFRPLKESGEILLAAAWTVTTTLRMTMTGGTMEYFRLRWSRRNKDRSKHHEHVLLTNRKVHDSNTGKDRFELTPSRRSWRFGFDLNTKRKTEQANHRKIPSS